MYRERAIRRGDTQARLLPNGYILVTHFGSGLNVLFEIDASGRAVVRAGSDGAGFATRQDTAIVRELLDTPKIRGE